jgi:hypothetical protein
LALFLAAAFPNFLEKVKHIRLRGSPFSNIKSFAPRHPNCFPCLKTARIPSLPFRRSSRLKQKELFSPLTGSLSWLIRLFLVRNRQFNPALRPAAFQDQPSTPGFHPGAEPELAVPLHFAGLISPFHGIFS